MGVLPGFSGASRPNKPKPTTNILSHDYASCLLKRWQRVRAPNRLYALMRRSLDSELSVNVSLLTLHPVYVSLADSTWQSDASIGVFKRLDSSSFLSTQTPASGFRFCELRNSYQPLGLNLVSCSTGIARLLLSDYATFPTKIFLSGEVEQQMQSFTNAGSNCRASVSLRKSGSTEALWGRSVDLELSMQTYPFWMGLLSML